MGHPDQTHADERTWYGASLGGDTDRPASSLEPPQGLFDRIEDAVAVPVISAPVVVEYSIDCNDVVTSTGGDWDRFALDNDGEELAKDRPQLTLWDQIQGENARRVWQLVVSEVRRQHSAATVPFRCDAPGMRRWYEIDVQPGEDGSVNFRSSLVFEEARPEIPLVRRGSERQHEGDTVELCCWCARGRADNGWISLDELVWSRQQLDREPLPEIKQGICNDCARSMSGYAEQLTPQF